MPSKMKTCEDYRTALEPTPQQMSFNLRSNSVLTWRLAHLCHATFVEEMQLFAAIDSGCREAPPTPRCLLRFFLEFEEFN